MACMISVGVTQPGVTPTPCSIHQTTISSLKPGETMNFAPHATAFLHCSSVMTVPAPTSISGHSFATASMESAAAAVRKVISITSTPPASSAFAVGTASAASSSTTTGTTAALPILSAVFTNLTSKCFALLMLSFYPQLLWSPSLLGQYLLLLINLTFIINPNQIIPAYAVEPMLF